MSSKAKSSASLIPERRFPGFSDFWTYEPLSSVLTEHKVKNKAGHEVFSVSMESGIVNQIEHLGRSFAAADTSHYSVGHHFDVVYTKSPLKAFPFGIVKQCKFEGEVALSPLYGVFTPKNRHVGLMIEAFFEAPERAQAFLSPLCQKGAKNTLQITNATFLSGKMALPKEEGEQQKIADCLDTADALIAAQGRKVEALRSHKKGLMQQLFPQEGETQPRLRFPEFRKEGSWSEKPVSRFIEEFRGRSSVQDEHEVMTSSRSGLVRQRDYYDNDRITERSNIGFNIIPPNYITYRSRSDDRTFYFNENNLGITGIVSIYYPVFRIRNGSNKFFIELFSSFSRTIGRLSVGTSQTVLSLNQLGRISLPMPEEEEQHRIADCLTSLDDLIAAEAIKLDTLKTHKKGLMQQLFPSMEGA